MRSSLFASGGRGVSGVGGRSNGEDETAEVEEVVTMVAKVTVWAMVLPAGQFSRDSQVGLGVVSNRYVNTRQCKGNIQYSSVEVMVYLIISSVRCDLWASFLTSLSLDAFS